jgi:hypothetical protein
MEILNWFAEYWDTVVATILIVVASTDKVVQILFKTAANIRDSWRELIG